MVTSGISSEGHSHYNICFTTVPWDRAISGAILNMEVQGDKKRAELQTEVLLRVGHVPYTPSPLALGPGVKDGLWWGQGGGQPSALFLPRILHGDPF